MSVAGTEHNIVDKYVPVGATSFRVDSTENWTVGDQVIVYRGSTAQWIADVGMNRIPPRNDGGTVNQWTPGSRDQDYERVITRIEGNRVFLNAPIVNAIEQRYGGGAVYKYQFPGRTRNVGIEHLRGTSDFASNTDEEHSWTFIKVDRAEDAWVRDVTAEHFAFSAVRATRDSSRVTVEDATSLDPKSLITGARRYAFNSEGQFILMKDLFSENGRHDFVERTADPDAQLRQYVIGDFDLIAYDGQNSVDHVVVHSSWVAEVNDAGFDVVPFDDVRVGRMVPFTFNLFAGTFRFRLDRSRGARVSFMHSGESVSGNARLFRFQLTRFRLLKAAIPPPELAVRVQSERVMLGRELVLALTVMVVARPEMDRCC